MALELGAFIPLSHKPKWSLSLTGDLLGPFKGSQPSHSSDYWWLHTAKVWAESRMEFCGSEVKAILPNLLPNLTGTSHSTGDPLILRDPSLLRSSFWQNPGQTELCGSRTEAIFSLMCLSGAEPSLHMAKSCSIWTY